VKFWKAVNRYDRRNLDHADHLCNDCDNLHHRTEEVKRKDERIMSSATNHKKRSRRGYKMQRSVLAPANSPLISRDKYEQRRKFREFIKKMFRHMNNRKDG
jgi:hypothetical protein